MKYRSCKDCPQYEKCVTTSNLAIKRKRCEFADNSRSKKPLTHFDLINRQQATINRLKAENKNCGKTIQNQREQLKACNEKIKDLTEENERLTKENEILSTNADTAFQDGLNEAQELYSEQVKSEVKSEIITEVKQIICDNCTPNFDKEGKPVNVWNPVKGYKAIDDLLKEKVGCDSENN